MPDSSGLTAASRASAAFRLDGEVAIVTGGGSGLGFGIARAFTAAGARVVVAGRRADVLRDAADALGPNASIVVCDVTEGGVADNLVAEAVARHGTISIVVNNAGIHLKKAVEETEADEFAKVMETHVDASFLMARAAAPVMKERGGGHILFIASMASFIGMPKIVAYSAAKAAQLGMVRNLAVELGGQGIRVNAIAPGWIESDMLHAALDCDPDRKSKIVRRIPTGRFGTPEDIGHAAVYLSSPGARYVSGVVLPVDGGALIAL